MALVSDNKEESHNECTSVTGAASSFTVKEHPDYGRYVIADDAIAITGLVLDEAPTMCAPWPIDEKVTFEEPLCLGCCMLIMAETGNTNRDLNVSVATPRKLHRCSNCHWPVCSTACEKSFSHQENECQLFTKTKLPYPPPGDEMNIVTTSVMIQLIRLLLVKRRNKTLWSESVLKLQSETTLGTLPWNFHLLLDDIKAIFPELEDELGSREECCKLLSIININAFSNTFNHNGEFSGCSICLFLDASMLAHSCAPNCWWTLTEDPCHRIIIKASEAISPGEMITVCYSNQYSVFGTVRREDIFRNVGGFTCKCRRCVDPSELGSFASGILCEHCMVGYKLPEFPTVPESKWKCDLCGHSESAEIINGIVSALEGRLEAITQQNQKPVPLLVRFLENCKTLVHNNHWIVTQTEDAIMKEWARDPDVRFGGSDPQAIIMNCEYFISICFHVLSVRNVVAPGLSFHRARYLLFFARARMALLEFLISLLEESDRHRILFTFSVSLSKNKEGIRQRHFEFQNVRHEYQEILQLYHEVVEYRHMSCATEEEIKGEIEHLIKLVAPVVQMEPRQLQEIINYDSAVADEKNRRESNDPDADGAGCTLS